MASKVYGYYNKGNKIAITEKVSASRGGSISVAHCTVGTHDNKADCEAAGGQWIPASGSSNVGSSGQYKSPTQTVDNAIEVEYAYSPTYNHEQVTQLGANAHKFLGYGSNGENLVFFTFNEDSYQNISSKFTGVGQWIYVDTGRWKGVHQVQSATASGVLHTQTKYHTKMSSAVLLGDFAAIPNTYTGEDSTYVSLLQDYYDRTKARPDRYVFVDQADSDANSGFFKLKTGAVESTLYFDKRYVISSATNKAVEETANIVLGNNDAIILYNAYYEPLTVYEDPSVLESDAEEFELDLTRPQSTALVSYLKAKNAEDMGDIEKYEYYMTQFRKKIEMSSNKRKRGISQVQGFWGMRK